MIQDIENFNRALVRYKFTNPVSPEDQRFAIDSGRDNLKYILKKTGYYSAIFGMILTLFYWARYLGLKVTLFKSKIIVAVVAANLTTAGVVGVKYVNDNMIADKVESEMISQEVETAIVEEPDSRKLKESIATKKITDTVDLDSQLLKDSDLTKGILKDEYIISNIRVQAFKGDDAKLANRITSNIASGLKELMGTGTTSPEADEKSKIEKIVTGSIRDFGSLHYITARIVGLKNIKVEYVTSEEFSSEEEIDEICSRITERIAAKLK